MSGPTLTMPPSFDTESPFLRSFSFPSLPDLVIGDFKRPSARDDDDLPRSASFTSLPALEPPFQSKPNPQRPISADAPPYSDDEGLTLKKRDSNAGRQPPKDKQEERPKLERTRSLVARPKSWIQRVKGPSERQNSPEPSYTTPVDAPPVPSLPKASRENKTKTVSESFATFARKSWMTSSRSPSPSRAAGKEVANNGQVGGESKPAGSTTTPTHRKSVGLTPRLEKARPSRTDENLPKPTSRTSSTLMKMKQRPQSVLMNLTNFNSTNSSASSLPSSSMDNRSTPRTSTDKIPLVPIATSTEKLQSLGIEAPKRRDELWSAFRSIENDFSKFQSKTWSLKTNVVRASLLPFLRNHALHPSNRNLRPEDLERRVTILNKWWTGLLEVLDGRQNQAVSGVDRPILLDACYAIMTRPEWRSPPSHFAPLSEQSVNRLPDRLPRSKSSTNSLNSSVTQFMTESVYHNTRNLFIQNLLSQMRFVVDKMSLRHAPASLVTFCGKAAAYAFFFVPGIAEILVRVWKLPADVLRRAADELGMPRRPNKLDMDETMAAFPAHLQNLGWISVKSMAAQLRLNPALPIMVAKIPWYGPWVGRWCGRDSDLFYVFAKHYHILAEEFIPQGLSLAKKARAPGFVLVQAQLLTALDATIHRQPSPDPIPMTFDDVLSGADASAAALPLPSNNSSRRMAENRLIMLLRDFISERPSDDELASVTFAEAFSKMMQATARRTSLFDHNACFVLADFMEEALTIFVRFHLAHGLESDLIDWRFWLDVCRKVLESENSMSEIRLFAFLFTTWSVVSSNERRKEIMCLEWLLTEETFNRFFKHWCPMVRAYYMRLLCWRICRDGGESSDLDAQIFSLVLSRIGNSWIHYLHLVRIAEKSQILPPSTAPCHPAPGRRLLIIRNDNQTPPPSLLLGFDGIMPSPGAQQSTAYKRHSSLTNLAKLDTSDSADFKLTPDSSQAQSNKKRWSFVGKMMPAQFSTSESTSSPADGSSSSPTKSQTLEDARREMAIARARPGHSKQSSTDSETPPATGTHRAYSFKFSLEWSQHFERLHGLPNAGGPIRGGAGFSMGAERQLPTPGLPAAAQACLIAKRPGLVPHATEVSQSRIKRGDRVPASKYVGRALAEWALIVAECDNFVKRRMAEGVPSLKWVEVPALNVEGFRRFG